MKMSFSTFAFFRRLLAGLALALAMAAPAMAAQPLVNSAWLNDHLRDANVVVLDVRSAIDGGGSKAYLEAHIPGSVHTDYDHPGWRVTVHNVPFMLPTILEIQDLIGNLGIDEKSHVVVVPAGVHVHRFRFGRARLLDLAGGRRFRCLDPRRRLCRLEGGRACGRARRA